VFYPYVVWSIFQGSIEVFLSSYTNGNVSFNEVFSLLLEPRAQFWFLYTLFFVFVVSSAVSSMVSKRYSILVFLLAAFLYLFPSVLPDLKIPHFLSRNLVFFYFGVIFTMYAKVDRISTVLPLSGALFVFIVGQWLFHGYLDLEYTDKGFESLLLALSSIIFVILLSVYLSKKSYGFLSFVGSSSMAIYLMHVLAGSGIRVILTELFGVDSFTIHLVLGCLVGIFAPLAVLSLINRANISYVFSAPISAWLANSYNKALQRTRS